MAKSPIGKALSNTAKDIKAGFKNIPKMYGALYNQSINPSNPMSGTKGVARTVKDNVNFITKAKPLQKNGETVKQAQARTTGTKAKLVALGATSVTPLGPVVGFIAGVNKSKQDRAKAKAQVTNTTPKTTGIKTTPTVGKPAPTKPVLAPKPKTVPTTTKPKK